MTRPSLPFLSVYSRAPAIDTQNAGKFYAFRSLGAAAAGAALLSCSAAAVAADTQAPTVPGGLRVLAASTSAVRLAWNRSSDNVAVKGYSIYVNNVFHSRSTGTEFVVSGLKSATKYQYRVSAFDAANNSSGWGSSVWVTTRSATATPAPSPTPTPVASTAASFSCTFKSSPRECGFGEQAKASPRAALTNVARDGSTAVRLRTLPGDSNVAGSGSAERNDLTLSQSVTGCKQGATQWWAHSVRFPDDYIVPPKSATWHWGVVFNFHHTGPTGQANLQLVSLPTGLEFWVAGGSKVVNGPSDPGHHAAKIGPIVKNTWYDLVYNVKWSSGTDGYVKGWVNGALKLNYKGPTLYSGQGCYLKLANYHSPLGSPVSVIHDRIMRGASASAVSNRTLQ